MKEREMLLALVEKAEVKINLKENGRWYGTAVIVLGGVFEIRGWRLGKSNYEDNPLWIQPPCYGTSKVNKPFYAIWTKDKEINSIIETKITEAFEERKLEDLEYMPF